MIGQKSGMVHAVDPDQKGKILWQTRAGSGSALGGSQWGSASDGQKVYVAISDAGIGGVADPKSPGGLSVDAGSEKGWRTACSRSEDRQDRMEREAHAMPAKAGRNVLRRNRPP